MTGRRRVLVGALSFIALLVVGAAITLSYESPCPQPPQLPQGVERMKAVVARCYGPPSVMTLEDVAKPVPADDEVLVQVHSAALNPLDWHSVRGQPYFMRLGGGLGAPDDVGVGVDFSGTVAAVGSKVTRFKVGDEVFGGRGGSVAQYVTVRESRAIALKPAAISHEQAGAIAIAAVTALQGLRDEGKLRTGQKVLINGASGGVGTFAVQIAKALGAEVTGVCSTRNVELVRSLGADHVIDYTQQNFTASAEQYDLILDNVGSQSLLDMRRVLRPIGRIVIVGGLSRDPWIGPMIEPLKAEVVAPFVDQSMGMFIAHLNAPDLEYIAGLASAGKLNVVIDKRYAMVDTPEALAYLESSRARGKVVIQIL